MYPQEVTEATNRYLEISKLLKGDITNDELLEDITEGINDHFLQKFFTHLPSNFCCSFS